MTDESLVIDFIKENFELYFSPDEVLIRWKDREEKLNLTTFKICVIRIFGEWESTDSQPSTLALRWFAETKMSALKELNGFLDKCKVQTTDTEVKVISPDGTPINLKDIVTGFNGINFTFVGNYVTDWLSTQKQALLKDILDKELDSCSVRLGLTEWLVINREGKVINEKVLKKKIGWASIQSIEKHFERWMSDKVIEASSKMMGEL